MKTCRPQIRNMYVYVYAYIMRRYVGKNAALKKKETRPPILWLCVMACERDSQGVNP